MLIIGLTGTTADGRVAGSGKDTFAEWLTEAHPIWRDGGWIDIRAKLRAGGSQIDRALANPPILPRSIQVAFADLLKETAQQVYGFSDEALWGATAERSRPHPEHGRTARDVLQALGVFNRSIFPDIWIDRLADRIRELGAPAIVPKPANPTNVGTSGINSSIVRSYDTFVISDVRFENEARWIREAGGVLANVRSSHFTTASTVQAGNISETESQTDGFRKLITHQLSWQPALMSEAGVAVEPADQRTYRYLRELARAEGW